MNYLVFIFLLMALIFLFIATTIKAGFKTSSPNYSKLNKEELKLYVVDGNLDIYKNIYNKISIKFFSIFSAIAMPIIIFYSTVLDRTPNILIFILAVISLWIIILFIGFYINVEAYPIHKLLYNINYKFTKDEVNNLRDMAQLLYDHSDVEEERIEKGIKEDIVEDILENTCNNINNLVYSYLYTPTNQIYKIDDPYYIKKTAITIILDKKYPELLLNTLKLAQNENAISELTINDWEKLNEKFKNILSEVEQEENILSDHAKSITEKFTNKDIEDNKNLLLKNVLD